MVAEQEYLRRLLQDSHVIELRHQHGGRWDSGTFDHLDPLHAAIRERAGHGNLYTSLNRPTVEAINRMGAAPLTDADISTITRIVFDLDPRRATGTASTDAELDAAIQARHQVVTLLTAHGWPTPALAMSGNGAHVVYRTRLKASPAWRRGAAALYMGMNAHLQTALDDLGVTFDRSVRNPARIWRLYGTVNRKGDHTARHRRAAITLPAGPWQPVRAATIKRTIASLTPEVSVPQDGGSRPAANVFAAPKRACGAGDYSTLDVVRWFDVHQSHIRQIEGNVHAVRCPWHSEHTTPSPASGSDTVVFAADGGWPGFHCHHAHCTDRTIRDVMALWRDADAYCARAWGKRHG